MTDTESRNGYTIHRMGNEKEPLVVIDDFFSDPDLLVRDASKQAFNIPSPYYPGIRAHAPADYMFEKDDMLREILTDIFGYTRAAKLDGCSYSLVTTKPEELQPIQSLPHYDSCNGDRIALLHYLCGQEKGGTSHYRHIATGFETVRQDRFETYKNTLEAEVKNDGLPPKSYFDGHHPRFEKIACTNARYNRMVLYRGVTLHSGDIPSDFSFARDVTQDRLTINTFLEQD